MKLLLQLLFAFFFIFFQTTCLVLEQNQDPIECKINDQDSSKVAYTITVSQSGGANFTTVKDAIKSIPADNNQWVKIAISPGTYTEKIQIAFVQCIILEGQDRTTTTITFDAHDNAEQSITFDSFTHNFVARGITFKNSYNLPNNANNNITPAVAFRAYGDKQAFYNCGFEGYQDTLWDDVGRHYYESCYIEGAVDFIWGEGASVYKSCTINVLGDGYITAQGKKSANDVSGYVFKGCNVAGQGHTTLGRAYNAFSTVIFWDSNFTNIINPEGWFIWNQSGHEGDVVYAEVGCQGAGANMSGRVKWMKNATTFDTSPYEEKTFIDKDGWIEKLP